MSDTLKIRPIHPIATIVNHFWLIVGITLMGTMALGGLVLLKVKPSYLSESAIEVTMHNFRLLISDQEKQFSSRSQYTDYINTQVNYIVSYENVSEAIKRMELPNHALQPGATDQETVLNYLRKLKVEPVRNTSLISIKVEDSQPKDLDLLVNALVDTFMDRHRASILGVNDYRTVHLNKELQKKKEEQLDKQRLLTELTLELGTLNFDEGRNPLDQELAFLREALNSAYVERVAAEHTYKALLASKAELSELDLSPLVEEYVQQDPNTVEMKNRTLVAQDELELQANQLTPDHPSNLRLRANAASSVENLAAALAESRREVELMLSGKMAFERERAIKETKAGYEAKLRVEQDIQLKYQSQVSRLNKAIPIFLEADQLKREIDRIRSRVTQIETRLEELVIESNEPGRLRLQSKAREPLYPYKDRRKIFLVLVGFFSGFMGLLAAFAIDYLKPSIVDPTHMEQILGSRPTGVLPHMDHGDFGQMLRREPESYHADQFRRIMAKIFVEPRDGPPPKLLTVISVDHGGGATSFALNMAHHLRQTGRASGLLQIQGAGIDLPDRVVGQRESIALGDAAPRGLPLAAMAVDGSEYYYPDGTWDKGQLSELGQIDRLLTGLTERTGCLIVDAPPLLFHAESEFLCTRSDIVVLVVSGPKTSAGQLKRSVNMLEELGVARCAVIANDLPILPGGYFSKAIAARDGKNIKHSLAREIVKALTEKGPIPRNLFRKKREKA